MGEEASILVVDDDKMNLMVMSAMLKTMGKNARMAKNGREAVEMVRERVPMLVLMDINMPEMNGIEAAVRIREEHPDDQIRLIAVTADATPRRRADCESAGFEHVMTKPVELLELRAMVETGLPSAT